MPTFPRRAALLLTALVAAGALAFETSEPGEGCFIVQHFYHPKAGMEEEALATRLRGADIRARLGLPTGRILRVESAVSGHPSNGPPEPFESAFLTSITEYADEAAFQASRARLSNDPEYREVLRANGELLRHFEQIAWRSVRGGCRGDGS